MDELAQRAAADSGGVSPPQEGHGLLCEQCGYSLGGLPEAVEACPECGLAIEDSRPQRRTGTPWQRRANAGTWLATNWTMLRRPRAGFGIAAMTMRGSTGLLRLNLLAASVILAGGWCAHLIRTEVFISLFPAAWWRVPISAALAAMVIGLPTAFAALWILTWIESRGIRFIGGRRGWRVTPEVARAVCGHASVGWIVAAVLFAAGMMGVWALDIQTTKQVGPNTFTYDAARPWRAPIGGLLIGLVVFEVLVNIGVRRCRYTNS